MMSSWWWWWMVCMFLFFVPTLGYGWGYRGWGPPYPRYFQRRRAQRAAASGDLAPFNHHAWGFGGDLLWMVFLIGMIWVSVAFWWR